MITVYPSFVFFLRQGQWQLQSKLKNGACVVKSKELALVSLSSPCRTCSHGCCQRLPSVCYFPPSWWLTLKLLIQSKWKHSLQRVTRTSHACALPAVYCYHWVWVFQQGASVSHRKLFYLDISTVLVFEELGLLVNIEGHIFWLMVRVPSIIRHLFYTDIQDIYLQENSFFST